jgi:pseudouridine kinase
VTADTDAGQATDAGHATDAGTGVLARRAVCAGGAVIDLKLRLDQASVAGTSNPATGSMSFGGVARNVAENLAVLLAGTDVSVELVSAVGDDEAGVALLAQLRAVGVDVRHIRIQPGAQTAQYVALLEPGGELTIGAAAMTVLDVVDAGAVDAAWPDTGWLFCDCNLPAEVLAHVLSRALKGEMSVAVDAVSTRKVVRLPADLTGIGLLSCNLDEGRAWLARHGFDPVPDDVELARRLQAAGARAVLLTQGAAGLIMAIDESLEQLPAAAASAASVDVTGAGDALIAATLAGLIDGADLATAVRAGVVRAARTIESPHSVLPGPG